MEEKMTGKEPKMKPFVFVRTRTGKGWLVALLYLLVICCGCAPAILNIFNKPILVCGFPLLMFWAICVVLLVLVVTRIAIRLGVK